MFLGAALLLAVGTSILNAFDRLEVAEYSARSLIDTTKIGPVVPIVAAEIEKINAAFDLP